MREIIFRGLALATDEWVEGAYVRFRDVDGNLHDGIMGEYGGEHISSELYAVDSSTIGQYTWLRDANNKRIFEGDILQFGRKRLVVWWNAEAFQWQAKEVQYPCRTFDGVPKGCVVWDNIDFGRIAAEVPITGKMTTAIIGNIYDNKDLLYWNDGQHSDAISF